MAQTSPLILAILIFVVVVAAILILLIFLDRRSNVTFTSKPTTITQCTLPPSTPINLAGSNPQSDIITLSWSPLSNVDTYTVYLGVTAGFNTASATSTRVVTTNSASFGNLQVGSTYYFKLFATNPCGNSPMSAEVSVTIPFIFPNRFVITKRDNPLLEVCRLPDIFFNANQQRVSSTCTDDGKVKFYVSSDKSIRRLANNSECLTRIGPNTVWDMQCGAFPGQDWVYDISNGSLCSSTNPLTECLFYDPNVLSFAGYGPLSTPNISAWDIRSI